LSIKSDTNSDLLSSEKNQYYDLNIHPPTNKLNNAVIDFILNHNWKIITVLFDDPNRIEELIRFSSSDEAYDKKIKFNFRIFSSHVYLWQYLLKEVKKSGSTQIIVDLKTEMINDFLRIVIYFLIITSKHFLIKRFIQFFKADYTGLIGGFYHIS